MAKENKFTKSVMERLMESEKKEVAAEKTAKPKKTTEAGEKTPEKKVAAPVIEKEEQVLESRGEMLPDISEFISKTPERNAKNKTFYLDTDVIEKLKLVAKKSKTTDSKLCNDILRKVLKLDE